MLLDRIDRVRYRRCRDRIIYLNANGIMHNALSELPDVIWHGGGKKKRLTLLRQSLQNLLDILQKTHIEHPVHFIDDEYFNTGHIDLALIHEVEQASRTRDNDFRTIVESAYLGILVDTPVNCDALQFCMSPQLKTGLMRLFRQLSGRRQNQGSNMRPRLVHEALKDWKDKGCSFTCSGLSLPDNIPVLNDRGDSSSLNRCGCCVTEGFDPLFNLRM